MPKPPHEGKICVILDLKRMTKKQEIQLFNDRRIRTIWDDKEEKWYFSVVDVIEALTETDRPRKYWSDLKAKLKKEGSTIKLISLIRSSFFVEVLYFFHTYYMLTLTNDLQIISQGACVGLQLKPL